VPSPLTSAGQGFVGALLHPVQFSYAICAQLESQVAEQQYASIPHTISQHCASLQPRGLCGS
jgi:hypothetical protein